MALGELYVQNRVAVDTVLSLLIVLLTFGASGLIHQVYALSGYRGVKYFRNVLFLFGLAFLLYLISLWYMSLALIFVYSVCFILASFFMMYSLCWKKCEGMCSSHWSCKVNSTILILAAVVFTWLSFVYSNEHFVFIPQLIAYTLVIGLLYNSMDKPRMQRMMYIGVAALLLIETFAHYIVLLTRDYPLIDLGANIVSVIVFAILFYMVWRKVHRLKNGGKKARAIRSY